MPASPIWSTTLFTAVILSASGSNLTVQVVSPPAPPAEITLELEKLQLVNRRPSKVMKDLKARARELNRRGKERDEKIRELIEQMDKATELKQRLFDGLKKLKARAKELKVQNAQIFERLDLLEQLAEARGLLLRQQEKRIKRLKKEQRRLEIEVTVNRTRIDAQQRLLDEIRRRRQRAATVRIENWQRPAVTPQRRSQGKVVETTIRWLGPDRTVQIEIGTRHARLSPGKQITILRRGTNQAIATVRLSEVGGATSVGRISNNYVVRSYSYARVARVSVRIP